MKRNLRKVTLVIASMLVFACTKKADLKTDKAKYSYAIGHQIGMNIKGQKIELDPSAFSMAVDDVSKGAKSQLTEEEMRNALKTMSEMRNKEREEKAKENLEVGKKFLEENKTKPGVKVTASGLQYKVIKEGTGPKPKDSDTVKVHYRGTFISGDEFDSSYKRNRPAEFPVKAVIPGWTEALQLMNVGSKYELYIPANLAYGEHGNPTIPGNSVLIFEVELLEIVKQEPAGKAMMKAMKAMKGKHSSEKKDKKK